MFGAKLPTSAGLQLLRAVEAVMRQYYDVLSNGSPRPKQQSMGNFTEAMEKIPTIDPRMLDVLKGIKNLRRNPLAHPQELESDDVKSQRSMSPRARLRQW